MRGFSLVELSIVLVILGLLTGGILAGQNLIRAAELRSVSTQYQGFVAATQTFRDKYFALPGDMRNATDFWGETASCPGTAGTGTQTCDGNGDGTLTTTGSASNYGEPFTFWQHLANAGLIEGSYTGIAGSLGPIDNVDTNSPRARMGNGVWGVFFANNVGGASSYQWDMRYGNVLVVGVDSATGNGDNWQALVTPEEAWNIDTKMDDGKPGLGSVLGHGWDVCTDAANDTDYNADYLLQETSALCNFRFVGAF